VRLWEGFEKPAVERSLLQEISEMKEAFFRQILKEIPVL